MNHDILRSGVRRVLVSQAVITLLTCAAFLFLSGSAAALAAAYGGGITLIGTWFLGRRVRKTPESAHGAQNAQIAMYAGVLPRFIVTLALLALGMGGLKLAPLPLIVGFALAQLGFLIQLASVFKTPQ